MDTGLVNVFLRIKVMKIIYFMAKRFLIHLLYKGDLLVCKNHNSLVEIYYLLDSFLYLPCFGKDMDYCSDFMRN